MGRELVDGQMFKARLSVSGQGTTTSGGGTPKITCSNIYWRIPKVPANSILEALLPGGEFFDN